MRRVMLTSPQPPAYAQGNHEQMRLAPDRADGEGPIAVLRDAARRDVARLAVAQRPDAEVERGRRHRPTQRDAHAAADLGGPRQVVVQGLGEVAPAGVVRRSEEHTSELQSRTLSS